MTESGKKFSAKRNEARLKDTWNILQDVTYT